MYSPDELCVSEIVEDVDLLIEIMRPSHEYWDGPGNTWAFRGQSDASWQLWPTAFRNDVWNGFLPPSKISRDQDPLKAQQYNEKNAFQRFIELADRIGHYIPSTERLFHLNAPDDLEFTFSQDQWPLPDIIEPLAVARHHGVPARLLDITLNPMVAAFFAADDVFRKQMEDPDGCPDYLAIWAINLGFTNFAWRSHQERVRLVRVPTGRNPFLSAQQGSFLIDWHANRIWRQKKVFEPIDQILIERGQEDEAWECISNAGPLSEFYKPPIVRKLKLPSSHAARLLDRLFYKEGLSKAHIMPTLDNVTNSLKDMLRVFYALRDQQ